MVATRPRGGSTTCFGKRGLYGAKKKMKKVKYLQWKVYRYVSGEVGIQIFDKTATEELYKENLKDEPAVIETYIALPIRHLYKK